MRMFSNLPEDDTNELLLPATHEWMMDDKEESTTTNDEGQLFGSNKKDKTHDWNNGKPYEWGIESLAEKKLLLRTNSNSIGKQLSKLWQETSINRFFSRSEGRVVSRSVGMSVCQKNFTA